jgi:hypothetical protein
MNKINLAFCRTLLALTMATVKQHTTAEERKEAWVYHFSGGDSWEFHGPNKFYWYGSADNAYDARSQGWSAYLRMKGIEE